MKNQITNLSAEEVLDKYQSLYKPEYRPRHHKALICFGVERYTELAEVAIKKGKHSGRYMSFLLSTEFEKYHTDRLNAEVAQQLRLTQGDKATKALLRQEKVKAVAFKKEHKWLEKGVV